MPTLINRPPQTNRETIKLKNNDPLAHVDLLISNCDEATVNYRTYIEYVTDMGERLKEQPFRKEFAYRAEGDNLISDTGVYLNKALINGYEAAINDVAMGHFDPYHAARAEGFVRQLEQIKNWQADESDNGHLVYFSLCPQDNELNIDEARRQSFKPERLMASVQLYEKTNNGIKLHAFSLDQLSLGKLGSLFSLLGVADIPAETTLQQLAMSIHISNKITANQAVTSIINHYDGLLAHESNLEYKQGIETSKYVVEANSHVESFPEAYDLYKQTIIEVAHSLETGQVNNRLGAILEKFKFSIVAQEATVPISLQLSEGQNLNRAAAGEVVEYLRTQAIPHYLTQQLHIKTNSILNTDLGSGSGYQGVSDAGAQAVASSVSYDGACPTSSNVSAASTEMSQLKGAFNILSTAAQSRQKWLWKTDKCVVNNCPTKPAKTKVGPCSVCVKCQDHFDKGRDPTKLYGLPSKSFNEMFGELLKGMFTDKKDNPKIKKN